MSEELDLLIDNLEFEDDSEEIFEQDGNTGFNSNIDFDEYIKTFFEKITASIDIESTLNIIIDMIHEHLGAEETYILSGDKKVIIDRNFNESIYKDISQMCEENILDWVKKEVKQTIYQSEEDSYLFIVSPLLVEGEFEGYILLKFNHFEVTPKFINIVNISANILAVFFAKRKIYRQLIEKSDNLEIKMSETKSLYDELLIVYDYVKNVSTIFNEKELFEILKNMCIRAFGVQKAFVFKFDRYDHIMEIVAGTDPSKLERKFPISEFFKNFETSKEVFYNKETESTFLKKHFELFSTFAAPIYLDEKLYAVIVLSERKTNKPYSEQDEKILSSLAQQTGFSLQNINLYNQFIEKQKIERDLELARNIQMSLLPERPPVVNNLDVCAISRPAKQVGGDYYDFYKIDEDNLWIILGDVSGKGIAASILMSMVRSMLRVQIRNAGEMVGTLLKNLNNLVTEDIYEGKFITFVTSFLNLKKNKIYFSNAGHLPTLIYKSKKDEIVEFEADALPLGIMENVDYPTRTCKFEHGDILIFYTDGINEAMNLNKDEFGLDRLKEIILNNSSESAPRLLKIILDEVEKFVGDAPQHDDTTIVIAKKVKRNFNYIKENVEIGSNIEEINDFVDKIVDYLEKLEIIEDEVFDVKLVVSELIINAAKHGNKFDNSKKIYIDYFLSREKIEMSVVDEGEGFKHSVLSDYDTRILEENGRGIILVSSMVDTLRYNRKGNKVDILKYFRGLSL